MYTEEKVDEMLKEERKKVFKRLYVLPWILLTISLIILLVLNSNMLHSNDSKDKVGVVGVVERSPSTETNVIDYKESQEPDIGVIRTLEDLEILEVIESNDLYKGFCKQAVKNGHGKWEVNEEGEVKFVWLTVSNLLKEVQKVPEAPKNLRVEEREIKGREVKFSFSKENYELANSLGIDIELEIKKRVEIGIERAFLGEDKETKLRVKEEVIGEVGKFFDGFETLNKIDKQYKEGR